MFANLVVPVDLSAASFKAVPVAARMAASVGGRIDVITVVDRLADVSLAREELEYGIERRGPLPVDAHQMVHASRSVTDAIARHVEQNPGSMVAMSSHGFGRSAAVLGSTLDELLRAMFGPVIVVGQHAAGTAGMLGGTYVVPLDGSALADGVLPIVGAWAVEFGGTPWLVEVVDRSYPAESGIRESSSVKARAADLGRRIGREVEFEVLHGRRPGRSIVDFANAQDASLILMSTHGRTGMARLTSGSVAAEVVRHAEVPVVIFRPPNVGQAIGYAASGTAHKS